MDSIPYILATAGHVDHGKSALVRALTGVDPDRLPEEKARGITIELGFAQLLLSSAQASFDVGIVDVPGHEDFVKNMVAGVGSIDAALLVVAADDGWMPQTEEHLQILEYLGVKQAVIALTKADLCESPARLIEDLRQKLERSPLSASAIVSVSVITGKGLDDLRQALVAMFAGTPPQPDIGKPRLAIDRVFSFKGMGTIVTGTLAGGALRRDQAVVIQPRGQASRIRSMQVHNREVQSARPGTRVAINLADVPTRDVSRGEVVTLPEAGSPSDTWDVLMERSARAGVLSLKAGARVNVHHGSAALAARVVMLDPGSIGAGERAIAQVRLERPALAFTGDRFVIRDWPEQNTLAGGIVLDPLAKRRHWRSVERRAFLKERAEQPDDVIAFVRSELRQAGSVSRPALLNQSRFSEAQIAGALDALKAVRIDGEVYDEAFWASLHQRAISAVDQEHKNHPERAGLSLTDLRAAVGSARVDGLIAALCREGFRRNGAILRRSEFQPALPPRLAAAGEKLRAALAARPFDPPSRKELTPDAVAQQAMKFLLINGEAVEVGSEAVLSAEAMARAVEIIERYIRQHGPATVSDLKTALASSRRIMVPLLEKLDRDGVTRRDGDRRVLRPT